MASRYIISSASRARTFHKSHVFLLRSRTGTSVLPRTRSFTSHLEGSSRPRHENSGPTSNSRFVGLVAVSLVVYTTQNIWKSWYEERRTYLDESKRQSTAYNALKKGPELVLPREIIPREDIVNSILTAITPTEERRGYSIVVGDHGTGKSTSVALALERLGEPKGVAYVRIPISPGRGSKINFANAMRRALGLEPNLVDKPELTVSDGLNIFTQAAVKYKQEHKKIPVLIIDSVNQLAEVQPEDLDALQEYAMLAYDSSIANLVFVSSEGHVPLQMGERSSWSRHGMVFEIGDISKEETLKYLKDRGIKGGQAMRIYELVGGRIVHLNQVTELILNGKTLQEARESILRDTEFQLSKAGMDPRSPNVKEVASVIGKLLEKGPISKDAYLDVMGKVPGAEALQKNVFSASYNLKTVDFQSTAMRRLCEEKWGRGKGEVGLGEEEGEGKRVTN